MRNFKDKMPYSMKQGLKYIYGAVPFPIRYGKVFRDTYKFLQKSQWWSREELEEYQMRQLKKLLTYAYENVPYYKEAFDGKGISPENIKSIFDIEKIPFLTKSDINKDIDNIISKEFTKCSLEKAATSGSSGKPLVLYWEPGVTTPKEWAYVWRQWNWAGVKFRDKRVVLRGNKIKRFEKGRRSWWEFNPNLNALILSSFDMTTEKLFKYVNLINKFKPCFIQAYPSSLYLLAKFVQNHKLTINPFKAILTSSETLYSHQKKTMESIFNTRIFDHYGNSEKNVLVMECEEGNYHVIPEYGIFELIDEKGRAIYKKGQMGEIVGTGFNNFTMPFIRYRTNDFAEYGEYGCDCGRSFPVINKIYGRAQDFLVTKQKNLVPLTSIRYGYLEAKPDKIVEFQFYQDKIGEVQVFLVLTGKLSEQKKQYIKKFLTECLEGEIKFFIKIVEKISRDSSGKYKFLVQKLPIEFKRTQLN